MIFSWNSYEQRDALSAKIKTWQATGKYIAKRLPAFALTEKLVAHASGVTGAVLDGLPRLAPSAPIAHCWMILIPSPMF